MHFENLSQGEGVCCWRSLARGLYKPAIAQLVEHLTVECCSNQMVPGSIPGGRIFQAVGIIVSFVCGAFLLEFGWRRSKSFISRSLVLTLPPKFLPQMLGLFLFVHGFGVPRASRKDVFHSGMHDDLEGHVDGSCWRAASVPVEEQRSCGLMDKAPPS